MTVKELWRRIEDWAAANAPQMLEDLNPGASLREVKTLESRLGLNLPADFRNSLLIHNGERHGWDKVFADYGAYLSANDILSYWQMRLDAATNLDNDWIQVDLEKLKMEGIEIVEDAIRPFFYSPAWIPILDFNWDTFWALDFDPTESGEKGQVIEVDWENSVWKVVARSFHEFLSGYVASLESGVYRFTNGRLTKEDA